MVDLLESSGTKGMTLNVGNWYLRLSQYNTILDQEFSGALGNFDRRTLELFLTKLEKVPPPTHLSDLRIAQLMETHGRERRWRYFTVASYREVIANEKLDDQDGPYSSVDFSNVGNFAPLAAEDFYGDTTELNRFIDYTFNRATKVEVDADELARSTAKPVTPSTLAGSTVRGRKRKREEAELGTDADNGARHTPRKRGRPRKYPLESQHGGPRVAKKTVTPHLSLHESGESREVPQPEGSGRVFRGARNDGQPPLSGAQKELHRPSDDNRVAPEGSSPTRRRGLRVRPPSPPFTGDVPGHPSFELRSPNAHASDVEARSTPKECGLTPQISTDSEKSAQPGFIVSDPGNYPPRESCTAAFNSNGLTSPHLTNANVRADQIRVERVADSDPGSLAPTETAESGKSLSVAPRTASLEPASAGQKRKEKSAAPHPRSNVSLLRRENEFLRILEESGGVAHPGSKEFLDAHLALLDILASTGEPTSGLPGVKVDKRTIENTFESLERKGKVKVLKSAISTATGAQRPIRIIYLFSVDQSKLDAFLTQLGNGPYSTPYSIDNPSVVSVLPGNVKARRPVQPLNLLQPERKADGIGPRSKNSGIRGDQDEEHAGNVVQAKELLAQKVASAKMRKEREWEAILRAVHPQALGGEAAIRVARVHKRYLKSGVFNDRSRWEDEVRDAIRELQGAAKTGLHFTQRTVLARPSRSFASVPMAVPPSAGPAAPLSFAGLPPMVASQPGKTIEQLITEQGPAREDTGNKKRKPKKRKDGGDLHSTGYTWDPYSFDFTVNLEDGDGEDDDQTHRRSRFLWNKDYDELAQDANAILRARTRETGARIDWFAMNKVFPAVPRNSVRQRISSLREIQSNEIYMRRLEEQWSRLWKQYRGTEHLPDPNPRSQTDFDLIKHIQFLRRFVDKNALCVLRHVLIISFCQSDQ